MGGAERPDRQDDGDPAPGARTPSLECRNKNVSPCNTYSRLRAPRLGQQCAWVRGDSETGLFSLLRYTHMSPLLEGAPATQEQLVRWFRDVVVFLKRNILGEAHGSEDLLQSASDELDAQV